MNEEYYPAWKVSPREIAAMKRQRILELEDVTIGYGNKPVLGGISFEILRGSFTGVLGPNGGGKSTLVKTILGLLSPLSGNVVHEGCIRFGYVPQNKSFDNIFPLSVFEVVKMGRYSSVPFAGEPDETDVEKVLSSIEKVGIENLGDRAFRSLSGGERQRALLARAIAGEPDLLVMDEPTTSIDTKGESEIMSLIKDIGQDGDLTILMISHFVDSVLDHSDELILVDKDRQLLTCDKKEVIVNTSAFKDMLGRI